MLAPRSSPIDKQEITQGVIMQWCRLYAEFATDPKVQVMSESLQRRLVMLFCFQAEGCLHQMDDETLRFAMHISETELQKTKEVFTKKGFIQEGSWSLRNWERRQRKGDVSNDRVKRYRERKSRDSNGPVTLHKIDAVTDLSFAPLRDRVSAPPPSASHSVSVSVSPEGSPEGRVAEVVISGHTGRDHDEFMHAIEILRNHETTEHLAKGLIMYADSPGVRLLEPWRLVVSACVCQAPNKSQTWNAFLAYARQATPEEYKKYHTRPTKGATPPGRAFDKWADEEARLLERIKNMPQTNDTEELMRRNQLMRDLHQRRDNERKRNPT